MKSKVTLTGQLKKTVILLIIAMVIMWLFSYQGIRRVIMNYTLEDMQQTASSSILRMNTSFLQMEQLYLAISQETEVLNAFNQKDDISFHNAVASVENRLLELTRGKNLLSSIILYQKSGNFYRLKGTMSNSGVSRLLYLVEKDKEDYIFAKLDNEKYIGYITRFDNGEGGVIMLMKERDIKRLFRQYGQKGMNFILAAGEDIVASDDDITSSANKSKDVIRLSDYLSQKSHVESVRVGYTPFQLWVSYTEDDVMINTYFMFSMAVMAVILLLILQVFLHFWRDNFFMPIQTIIGEVETFEGEGGKYLPFTGHEHFDGLITGINNLVERIESKDKALIVSLKKQINAHFIFNTLNIIKALAEKGESQKSGEMCSGLSILLRYANEGEKLIDGIEEFHILGKYVEIMKIRYPDRFTVDIEMDDFLENVKLPRMLLQPIVENSIMHGLISGGIKGTVHVYAFVEEKAINFVVEDDGCGMDEETISDLRQSLQKAPLYEPELEGLSHVALTNIERRIKFYFGNEYGLSISTEKGKGTKVTMTLPL